MAIIAKHKHGHKAKDFKTTCAFQHFLLQMTLGEAILGCPTNSPNESLTKSYVLGGKAWILSQKTINCSSYLGFLEPREEVPNWNPSSSHHRAQVEAFVHRFRVANALWKRMDICDFQKGQLLGMCWMHVLWSSYPFNQNYHEIFPLINPRSALKLQ